MPDAASGVAPSFGYRVKVPLALTLVALVSGILVAATTYMLVDRHVETNAEAETRRLAGTLARALVQPVLRNDVWQAFQTMRAATQPLDATAAAQAVEVVALDARGQVFATPSPRVHPLGQHLSTLPEPLAQAARRVLESSPPAPARIEVAQSGVLVLATPIVGDEDALLGVVLASHPRALTEAQRVAVIRQLVILGAVAMLVVALAGGVVGLRMTAPLTRLREVMQAMPRRAPADAQAAREELDQVCGRRDEVGELGRSFAAMMDQIAAQQELERHMLEAERMASIGQLTAGIAHEVNNPLGGMLAAIENRRLRGNVDEPTSRTLALLDRGLRQVHETVQALLNEARSERHPLTASDLRDLELLLRPEAEHVRCRLDWQATMPLAALPAVPVRQVLLNLTLNAIAAAGAHGEVRVWTADSAEAWAVWVGNSGAALDAAKLAALTQGSERSAQGRLGLGLWITARILHTAGGRLRLAPAEAPMTTVLVAEFLHPTT
ncbi:ATP-binding protein [Piscinibacter defluvii]|uniref:ATP-binding protein n=1 Tax=Piscinibacter defluvii TaxID=1796922 RepID=UPI000FDE8797|nr:HAMP domain-containing sensor histidine kinase [Piscinibacter defluvii]